jgi:ferredoxin
MPHRITQACTKCGACMSECPTEAILEGQTQFYIDTDTCLDHKACVAVCPVKAIGPIPTKEIPHVPSTREEDEED